MVFRIEEEKMSEKFERREWIIVKLKSVLFYFFQFIAIFPKNGCIISIKEEREYIEHE